MYQRERRGRRHSEVAAVASTLPVTPTSPGDEDRKQRVLAHGLECMRRIKGDQTWEDWMGIGEAMMVITEEAMETVGSTVWNKDDRRLVKEFGERWNEYELRATNDPRHHPLSKQERWALREVMTNPEIGGWRSTLDGVNRRKLNHPNKVIERWRRATQTSDREPKRPSPSMSQALKEKNKAIDELEARNRELGEELEGRGAGQTIEELVAALASMLKDASPERQFEVISDLAGRLGIGTEQKKARRRKAERNPFKQAEDAINAAVGGLMKGSPKKRR